MITARRTEMRATIANSLHGQMQRSGSEDEGRE
jgi:hypothetical protein